MLIKILGIIGMGSVWGWLMSNLDGELHLPIKVVPIRILGTALFVIVILVFNDLWAVLLFLGTSILVLLLHLTFFHHLFNRLGTDA